MEELLETCEDIEELLEYLSKIAQLLKEKIKAIKEEAQTIQQLKQKHLPNLIEALEDTQSLQRTANHFITELKTTIETIEKQMETLVTHLIHQSLPFIYPLQDRVQRSKKYK